MKSISLLNDVLGPIMRGPSSSHTAGPYHIGLLASSLLGEPAAKAVFSFDPGGSFAEVYRQQASDLGFVAGVLGLEITGEDFMRSTRIAAEQGLENFFKIKPLLQVQHPNTVEIELTGISGGEIHITADSIGGGAVLIHHIDRWPVNIDGNAYEIVLVLPARQALQAENLLSTLGGQLGEVRRAELDGNVCLQITRSVALGKSQRSLIQAQLAPPHLWEARPIFFVKSGKALFSSAAEMLDYAHQNQISLGQAAMQFEMKMLDLDAQTVREAVLQRYAIMQAAVSEGLSERSKPVLLESSAGDVYRAESARRLALGGPNTRAAARALAVMQVATSSGVICAAPTGGSSGVIPGVMATLVELFHPDEEAIVRALLAASAVGLVLATRASFAAEEYGCNVEIGAASAMGAAAVVEMVGGTPAQALNAAAICFQNSMGATCDPVQGITEIPCYTRNAVGASDAFLVADLVLGGYQNPIPLDETIDAVAQVGRLMPREIKCTALGGLSLAPSGLRLEKHNR